MAGRVRVDGHTVYKPGHMVSEDSDVEVVPGQAYVSRGGDKLEGAVKLFRVDTRGKVCLDVGSSTGGFTDCLLQNGAHRVHCVDVGKGQLDWRLRNDDRVVVHEGINARYLAPDDIGEGVALATVDVSFISVLLILPPLQEIVDRLGELIVLVKPQFEAGRERVKKGGIVRDVGTHLEVLNRIRDFVESDTIWKVAGAMPSPIRGAAGNVEFFFHMRNREAVLEVGSPVIDLAAVAKSGNATASCDEQD